MVVKDKGFAPILLLLGVVLIGSLGFVSYRTLSNNPPKFLEKVFGRIEKAEVNEPPRPFSAETNEVEVTPTLCSTCKVSQATPTQSPKTNNTIKQPTQIQPTTPPYHAITAAGFAYEDRTDDGVFNSDDPKLPYMQFYLYDSYTNQQISTVYTDTSGNFSITLDVRGGLIVKPTTYNNFIAKSSEQTITSSNTNLVFRFRSASAPVPNQTIGILEGNIYQDTNRNRVRDSGENSVYFYKLYLKSNGNYFNTVENAQTTDQSGHFKYMNLPVPATYVLTLSNPTGDYDILQAETSFSLTATNPQNTNIEIPVFKY